MIQDDQQSNHDEHQQSDCNDNGGNPGAGPWLLAMHLARLPIDQEPIDLVAIAIAQHVDREQNQVGATYFQFRLHD